MKLTIPKYLKGFPRNYYGNKARLMNHIFAVIPKHAKVFIDLFGGAMVTGYSAKRMLGVKVITNDILRYSYLKGKVFIANNGTLLSDEDLKMLCAPNARKGISARKLYGHIFGKKNATFIDNWTANIPKLSDPIKRDIAVLIPIICTNKHFRFAATHFSSNEMPTGGMQLWEVDLQEDVIRYAKEILPKLVCDNGKDNEVYNQDSVELLNKVKGDVLYVDSPYVCRGSRYEDNYSFWDDISKVLTNKADEIGNRYDGKCVTIPYTDFTTRASSLLGFTEILKRAKHIPLVIFSYNTTSDIAVEEIANIANVYGRTVTTQSIKYHRPITNKANNRDTNEVLIVCSNDPNYKPTFYNPEPEPPTVPTKAPHGTKEWAKSNINCCQGCSNDCQYCYAKSFAIRFDRSTPKSWKNIQIRKEVLSKKFNKRSGTIMFPTSHDIVPENVDACIKVLKSILSTGNKVLIVSKPNFKCIKKLCSELKEYRKQILFRFTIGSANNKTLKYWEPGAPSFQERLNALKYAHKQGFKTSLSCEPMLDGNIHEVIRKCRPFVTDSIWLGLANKLRQALSINVPGDKKIQKRATELIELQDDDFVQKLYKTYKNDSLIKWKDSLKKRLGLEQPTERGLDV